jgi:hypothetical protein
MPAGASRRLTARGTWQRYAAGVSADLSNVAFRQQLVDEPLPNAIPHRIQLVADRSRVLVVLRGTHALRRQRCATGLLGRRRSPGSVGGTEMWRGARRRARAQARTFSSCCTMLPYVSVNTSALILSIFWNACSPIRVKFLLLPAILRAASVLRCPPSALPLECAEKENRKKKGQIGRPRRRQRPGCVEDVRGRAGAAGTPEL